MESGFLDISTFVYQMLNTMNTSLHSTKISKDLTLKEIPSAKTSDLVIKEFLHNLEFLYDSYVKNSSTNSKINLNLKIDQINDINRILHLTNFLVNSNEKSDSDMLQLSYIKTENISDAKINNIESDDLTTHATKSVSNSSYNNEMSIIKKFSDKQNFLDKKSINNYEQMNYKFSENSNDFSFLHDIDSKQINNKIDVQKIGIKKDIIIPTKHKSKKKKIIFNVHNDKTPYPNKIVRKRKRSKYRLDRVHTKVKIMVNNFIHNNLMLAAKDENVWLFKLTKDVLQKIKLQKNNCFYNKPIKEIFSIDSTNPTEIKRTNHNKNVLKECLSEDFQLYINKKYRDILIEYTTSADYTKDFEDISQAHEPEYVLLLKSTFEKASL